MEKACKECQIVKPIIDFYKNKKIKSGYESKCKSCIKEEKKIKSEELNLYNKEYYIKNKLLIKEKRFYKSKEYYQNNKEVIKNKSNEYYQNNKEVIKLRQRDYVNKNKDSISLYKKDWTSKNRNRRRDRHRFRMYNDVLYRLSHTIRSIINIRVGCNKNAKTSQIIGCTFEELRIYIESKFEPWMNWDNYGKYNGEFNYGWDIDHIIPISTANTEEDIIKLNHYTNLQPLCSKINRYIKKDKIEYENMSI